MFKRQTRLVWLFFCSVLGAGLSCEGADPIETLPPSSGAPASTWLSLSHERGSVRQFEPIYLKLERADPQRCPGCPLAPLEEGILKLQIKRPGEPSRLYVPPMMVCSKTDPDPGRTLVYQTVILSAGALVTADAGPLELTVLDATGAAVSNALMLQVLEAGAELRPDLAAAIAQHAPAYGMYVYLAGGDHLPEGSRIVHALADAGSDYSRWARPILANNYARMSYDWTNQRVQRPADLGRVRTYLPAWTDGSSENIKMEIAQSLVTAYGVGNLDEPLRARLREFKQRVGRQRSLQLDGLSDL